MNHFLQFGLCLAVLSGLSLPSESSISSPEVKTPAEILKLMEGSWEGNVRTWFKPGSLDDESTVKGKFTPILGGRFLRHEYIGSMKGKPRTGEETIVYNKMVKKFEVSWFDDFHMNYGILFSVGPLIDSGFSVTGKYAYGDQVWGWRTEYKLIDKDHLTITAYNVTPQGEELKGIETVYHRVSR